MKPKVHPTIYQRLLRAFTVSEIEPLGVDLLGKKEDIVPEINSVNGYQKHDTKECYASKK
jgi:hypothetical protein